MADIERVIPAYRLVLRRTARGPMIQFRGAGRQGREVTLVRVGGKKVDQLFLGIVKSLKELGLVEEEVETANYTSFRLRPGEGAAVGGFLLVMRRSRDPTAWAQHFKDLLGGDKYPGSRELLASVLTLGLQLSELVPSARARSQLNPRVLDALSAGLKVTARKLWGIRLAER
ncbi:MAG: hypothetical protein ACP5HK_04705 [Acidilobus sp.]